MTLMIWDLRNADYRMKQWIISTESSVSAKQPRLRVLPYLLPSAMN